MNTIKKWLLTARPNGEVDIFKQDVNIHMPINRKLDEIGFYSLDVIHVNGRSYLYVFDACENHRHKTKLLISRIDQMYGGEGLVDMQDDDYDNVLLIIEKLMIAGKALSC